MPMSKSISLKQMLCYSKKPGTTDKTLRNYVAWLNEQEEAVSESIEQCKTSISCDVDCGDEMRFVEECFDLVKLIAQHPNVEQATLCDLVLLVMEWSAAELMLEIIEPINDPYTLWRIYEQMEVITFDGDYENWEKIRQTLASKDVSNARCFNNIEYPDLSLYDDEDEEDEGYWCEDDEEDDYYDDDDESDRHFAEEFWGPAFDDAMEK